MTERRRLEGCRREWLSRRLTYRITCLSAHLAKSKFPARRHQTRCPTFVLHLRINMLFCTIAGCR